MDPVDPAKDCDTWCVASISILICGHFFRAFRSRLSSVTYIIRAWYLFSDS